MNKLQQQHANISTEEICRIFTETALKPDKCIDFDIKYWIEKYDIIRKEPRFAEIAMLIMSAAQIYGRKVDYVEEFILNLCKSFKSLDEALKQDGQTPESPPENRPRRRTKRMRPEMLSEKLVRTEYVPKLGKIVPLARVTEKLCVTWDAEEVQQSNRGRSATVKRRSLKQDVLQWKLNHPDEQGKTKPRAATLKIEEEELYSRYTNFGKSYLYDYEDDDVIGVKKEFKAFAGYIEASSNALLSDLNMRKFYKQQEEAAGELYDEESMERECDFLEDTRGGSPCRDEAFTFDCPGMEVDSTEEGISSSLEVSQESSTDHQESSSTSSATADESLGNSSLANASHSTTLLSESSGDFTTLDTSSRVIPQMLIKSKVSLKVDLELKQNFLGLPEKLLRRKAVFALPKEMTKKGGGGEKDSPTSVDQEEKQKEPSSDFEFQSGIILGTKNSNKTKPEKLFINLSVDLRNIPTPPASPVPDDEEDFIGFDETPEFNDSDVFTSTLARLSLDSSLFLPKAMARRSMSQDSGFLTPPASLRFSCDEDAGPSDVDSGLGASSLDDEGQLMSPREKTDESLFLGKEREKEVMEDDISVELTEKHKRLQDQAEKRQQERLEANVDVTVEVNRWHAYLKPILKASHARANFDIHAVGTEILEQFPGHAEQQQPVKEVTTITFADVVAEKEQPDICRYFLSTLLLANTENIRLSVARRGSQSGQEVTEYKDMRLTFLSAERHYQEINEMYDDAGVLNTNVKKRMREEEEEVVKQVPGPHMERTPKKARKESVAKRALKVLESSPADSGYLSGFEEGASTSGIGSPNRKRSISGEMVVMGRKKKNMPVF